MNSVSQVGSNKHSHSYIHIYVHPIQAEPPKDMVHMSHVLYSIPNGIW